jgi:DNA polymerase-3 subunit chi
MARVDFYRLTRDPVSRVLPAIAERVLASGARMLVVAGDAVLRSAISEGLWAGEASFLANGPADGEQPGDDPILIASTLIAAPANGAAMVALADGEWRDAALAFERAFLFFDNSRIDDARAAWRLLAKQDNVEAHFWLQDERGRWQEGPKKEQG